MAAASKIEMERRMLMSPFVGTLTLIASTIETRQNVHPLHHTYIVDALLAPQMVAGGRFIDTGGGNSVEVRMMAVPHVGQKCRPPMMDRQT
jgi:hypothetical protein